jgi:sn-1 stearoyl-lipid 9-desaturase
MAQKRMALANNSDPRKPINWLTTFVMVVYHVLAVVALFHFSWKGVGVAAALWWVSGSLGIGIGYHRLLTHRGFRCPKWLEHSLAVCGTLALEGGPIFWVGIHRMHHQLTDKEGDPHSPRDGKWWSHMGWILTGEPLHQATEELAPYVPDLRRDRFYLWLSRYHWITQVVVGVAVLYAFGWNVTLWAIFLRTVVGLHATWMVNSATHLWGSKRWATGDDSTNNFLVALVTFGEGWHNNHHAHPSSARHGLRWWEIDTNWYVISALHAAGLARDIKLPRADSRIQEIRHEEVRPASVPAPIYVAGSPTPKTTRASAVRVKAMSGD